MQAKAMKQNSFLPSSARPIDYPLVPSPKSPIDCPISDDSAMGSGEESDPESAAHTRVMTYKQPISRPVRQRSPFASLATERGRRRRGGARGGRNAPLDPLEGVRVKRERIDSDIVTFGQQPHRHEFSSSRTLKLSPSPRSKDPPYPSPPKSSRRPDAVGAGGERVLMREWLTRQVESGEFVGMRWFNAAKTQIRIPWKHGSKAGWSPEDDCRVFKAWAEHTGKDHNEPKRWKANFRCALHSLGDVIAMKGLSQKRGADPFMVYELQPERPRKSTLKKAQRSVKAALTVKIEPYLKTESLAETTQSTHQFSDPSLLRDRNPSLPQQQQALVRESSCGDGSEFGDRPLGRYSSVEPTSRVPSRSRPLFDESLPADQSHAGVIPTMVMDMESDDSSSATTYDRSPMSFQSGMESNDYGGRSLNSVVYGSSSLDSSGYDGSPDGRTFSPNSFTESQNSVFYDFDNPDNPELDPELQRLESSLTIEELVHTGNEEYMDLTNVEIIAGLLHSL